MKQPLPLFFFFFIYFTGFFSSVNFTDVSASTTLPWRREGTTKCLKTSNYLLHHFEGKKTVFYYLLYDVKYVEGFSMQVEVFQRITMVVIKLNSQHKRLKKAQSYEIIWVLVLPPWCYMPHWKHQGDRRIDWSSIYNMEEYSQLIPFIEYEEWLLLSGNNDVRTPEVDKILYFKHHEDLEKPVDVTKQPHFEACSKLLHFSKEEDEEGGTSSQKIGELHSVVYAGFCGRIKAPVQECYSFNFLDYNRVAEQLLKLFPIEESSIIRGSTSSSILLKHAENILVPIYSELVEASASGTLLPLKNDINSIHSFLLAHTQYDDYLAIHVRRGDFLAYYNGKLPSLSYIILKVRNVMKKMNLRYVFIASDATVDELKQLQRGIGMKRILSFDELENAPAREIIAQKWIASNAPYFIGTKNSRFSLDIRHERTLNGFPIESSIEEFCLEGDGTEKCLYYSRDFSELSKIKNNTRKAYVTALAARSFPPSAPL